MYTFVFAFILIILVAVIAIKKTRSREGRESAGHSKPVVGVPGIPEAMARYHDSCMECTCAFCVQARKIYGEVYPDDDHCYCITGHTEAPKDCPEHTGDAEDMRNRQRILSRWDTLHKFGPVNLPR